MNEKQEALQYIRSLAEGEFVSREEVLDAYDSGAPQKKNDSSLNKKVSVQDMMYFVGAGIVFFGLVILVGQNWQYLNTAAKVLITLGSAFATFVSGVLFLRHDHTEKIGLAFHLIAALIFPVGIAVAMDTAGVDISQIDIQVFISGILFFSYFASYFIFKKDLFTLFAIIYGTWLYAALVGWAIDGQILLRDTHLLEYEILVLGLTYLALGFYFSTFEQRKSLHQLMNGLGILLFLGSTLALGGWKPHQEIIWEVVYPFLIAGVLYLSVKLKSSSFLTFGTIFLMIYILKITGEYFTVGLGWPLALVCAGFLLMVTAYASFYIKKNFFSRKKLATPAV